MNPTMDQGKQMTGQVKAMFRVLVPCDHCTATPNFIAWLEMIECETCGNRISDSTIHPVLDHQPTSPLADQPLIEQQAISETSGKSQITPTFHQCPLPLVLEEPSPNLSSETSRRSIPNHRFRLRSIEWSHFN